MVADAKYKKQKITRRTGRLWTRMQWLSTRSNAKGVRSRRQKRSSPRRMRNSWRRAGLLRSRLSAIGDELARLEKERRTGKATLKRDKPSEKLVEAIDRLEMIKAFKLQMVDWEAGKEVALGTSETNYLDPR